MNQINCSIAFMFVTLLSISFACQTNDDCKDANMCCFYKPWMGPEGVCSPWKKEGDSCAGIFNGCPCGQGLTCTQEADGKFCRSSSRLNQSCTDDSDCKKDVECCILGSPWNIVGRCKMAPTEGQSCSPNPFQSCACTNGTICTKESTGSYCRPNY